MKTVSGLISVVSVILTVLLMCQYVSCKTLLTHPRQKVFVISTSPNPENFESETEYSTAVNASHDYSSINLMSKGERSSSVMRKRNDIGKTVTKPEIYFFQVQSDIRYRYSRTYVTSRVANRDKSVSQEVTFRVVLPETAFISKFVMEIDGKNYDAYVKEKEEAKKVYSEAQNQGQSAGLVELNSRHSNIFNVNVNIKAQSKVTFNLTYEELLPRRLGRYEQIINISPEQVAKVDNFKVVVNIEESQNITFLRIQNLRNVSEAGQLTEDINGTVIVRPAANRANITWSPSEADQTALSKQGIVVQYDIQRNSDAGEVLVMEGYFVHFFAPTNLQPLRKHVIFILDISGSMWGRKIEQLKESQKKILEDLSPDDYFNIITFSSDASLWSPNDVTPRDPNSHYYIAPSINEETTPATVSEENKKQPIPATPANIEKAKIFIDALVASGGTNIHDAITLALNLTESIRNASSSSETTAESTTTLPQEDTTTVYFDGVETTVSPSEPTSTNLILPQNVETLVIFLTDGEPTVGISNPQQIQTLVKEANANISVPIFSLAFGDGADFQFVRKLSLQNHAFARKIYEAADSVLQLQGFYNEIASPLLSNVTFNYTSPEYNITDVTITKFPTVFGGTEIVVAGKLNPVDKPIETTGTENATQLTVELKDEKPESPNKDDRELVRTDELRLNATIVGLGREGLLDFFNPDVFRAAIPRVFSDVRPYPPRPTAPPSQEDQFLERLWAYLTIQQLINIDLAEIDTSNTINDTIHPTPTSFQAISSSSSSIREEQESASNTTIIKETNKQKALRLALKYSFVTSLTSLVVVKPNASDIANTDYTDSKPSYADSLSSPQSMPAYAVLRPPHSQIKFALSSHIGMNNFAALGQQTPVISNLHPISFGMAHRPVIPYQHVPGAAGFFSTPATFQTKIAATTSTQLYAEHQSTKSTSTPTPSTPPVLSLKDVRWFKKENPVMVINTADYLIKQNQTNVYSTEGNGCTIRSTSTEGQCRHLQDCVQPEFIDDIQLFQDSYFCPIQSRSDGVVYVGTCCHLSL